MEKEEVLRKINSVFLCLQSHPDNEINSEFADRINDLIEIESFVQKQFTEKDLVDFGNYLLSPERQKTIKTKENIKKVHDCDIANFKFKQK